MKCLKCKKIEKISSNCNVVLKINFFQRFSTCKRRSRARASDSGWHSGRQSTTLSSSPCHRLQDKTGSSSTNAEDPWIQVTQCCLQPDRRTWPCRYRLWNLRMSRSSSGSKTVKLFLLWPATRQSWKSYEVKFLAHHFGGLSGCHS